MTNEDLKKELKEKVKERQSLVGDQGVKPSHLKKLKRSKSADDIANIPPAPPLPNPCPNCPKLQTHLDKANNDWIIASQKNIDYLKEWQEQNSKIKSLTKELNETIDDAVEEINKGEKNQSRLRTQLSQAQTQLRIIQQDLKNYERAAELRVNNPYKGDNSTNWWTDYTPLIIFFGLYFLAVWMSNKNTQK